MSPILDRLNAVFSGWLSRFASTRTKWLVLFSLWLVHGLFSLAQFFLSYLPTLDLSYQEALLAASLLAWLAFSLALLIALQRNSPWLSRHLALLEHPPARDTLLLSSLLALLVLVFLGIFRSIADVQVFSLVGYLRRLSPLLDLITLALLEFLALLLLFALSGAARALPFWASFGKSWLWVALPLAALAAFIARTGLGIGVIYKGDWARGLPAVPLLEWQILLACLLCLLVVYLESQPGFTRNPRLDLWIALLIWLAAAAFWLSQPLAPNSSALQPRAPNFEVYPFNDSQTYDEFSQSLLIGSGFSAARIPQRPLYILFLTLMHLLAGQGYNDVINLQTLVFAFFPVLLYLFGRQFFGRPIGLALALLAILRDFTANLVSPFTGNITYSKLYLSEIPTAMLLILFLLLGMRWIRAGFPFFQAFLMGGVLGLAMLIRTQALVALPVILFFALLSGFKQRARLLRTLLVMGSVTALVVAPWLWRNWRLTGSVIFDSPESQTINLALRYSRINGIEPQALPLPGESNTQYIARLKQIARQAILSNPLGAARGIASSFLNHGVNNLLLFPLQNDIKSLSEWFIPADAFWEEWEGVPTPSQSALLLFYGFLLSLGIVAALLRNGWLGLLPLALNLAYNLWTSLALLSGQRFMLSMDWSVMLYYMLGVFTLLSFLMFALRRGREKIIGWYTANTLPSALTLAPAGWASYLFAGLFFLGVGVSLPLSERLFPQRYPPLLQAGDLQAIFSSSPWQNAGAPAACLSRQVLQGEITARQGRALFPRYYPAGEGETFTDSFGYKATAEGRLVFQFLAESGGRIVFAMPTPPSFFPHASDVTMFLSAGGDPQALFVEQGTRQALYLSSAFMPGACP